MKLILGSQSPRRRELLGRMGLEFSVLTAEIDETKYETEDPAESVRRICAAKAQAVAKKLLAPEGSANFQPSTFNCQLVLTADTVVVLDGKIMGKPHDEAEARAMLRALSGREHEVYTAFCLLPVRVRNSECKMQNAEYTMQNAGCGMQDAEFGMHNGPYVHVEKTLVKFRELTEAEIAAYVATGEPMDKAGAYGIQDLGAMLVESIRGDYFTVMGLPVCQLGLALKRFGIDPLK